MQLTLNIKVLQIAGRVFLSRWDPRVCFVTHHDTRTSKSDFFFTSNRCTITSLKGSFGYMSSQNEWKVNVIRPRDAEGRGEYSCYILKRYYKLYNKQTGKPFTFTAESHPTPRLRRTREKNTLIFSTYYILLINHMSLVHRDKQH